MKYRSSLTIVATITLCLALPAYAGEFAFCNASTDAWTIPSGHPTILVTNPTLTVQGQQQPSSKGNTGTEVHVHVESVNVTGQHHGNILISATWEVDNVGFVSDSVTLSSTNHASGQRDGSLSSSATSTASVGDNNASGATSATIQVYGGSGAPGNVATNQTVSDIPAMGHKFFSGTYGAQADHNP